jgi:hypothetical protein
MNRFSMLTLLAAAVLMVGCSDTSEPAGQGQIQMYLVDAPAAFDAVNIVVRRVEVHRAGADSTNGWITVRSDSAQFDLLQLRNGASSILGGTSLDAGQYTQIRLIIGAGSHVIVDGVRHDLTIPSGFETGVKLNHPFTIESGNLYELTLDFDAARSVRQQGMAYRLQPVIRLIAQSTSGTISGTALPVAAQAKIWTVAGSDTVSALADTTSGFFKLMALPEGSYTVHVDHTAGSYQDTVITGVAVVRQQNTNLGTITLN